MVPLEFALTAAGSLLGQDGLIRVHCGAELAPFWNDLPLDLQPTHLHGEYVSARGGWGPLLAGPSSRPLKLATVLLRSCHWRDSGDSSDPP